MKTYSSFAIGLVLTAAAQAAQQTPFTGYLHTVPSPVVVPGGTTTFVLDPVAPVGAPPLSQEISVIKSQSAAFPTFVAPAFAEDAVLPIKVGATVFLSANLQLGGCGDIDGEILQIDPAGVATVAANVRLTNQTIPQGSMSGTVGFGQFRLTSPGISCTLLDGIPVVAGGSVGVRVVVGNGCNANRSVALAYDGAAAPAEVDFVEPTEDEDRSLRLACQQKCGTEKLKASAKKTAARNKCYEKAVQKSLPVDPLCLSKATDAMASTFQKTEAKGGCVFTGDYAAIEGAIDAAIDAWVGALAPVSIAGDSAAIKCATSKIKAAGTKAESKIKCYASSFGKGEAVDPDCLGKANDKFESAFAKAEGKGGCVTTSDAAATEATVDGLVDFVVDALVPANPS